MTHKPQCTCTTQGRKGFSMERLYGNFDITEGDDIGDARASDLALSAGPHTGRSRFRSVSAQEARGRCKESVS